MTIKQTALGQDPIIHNICVMTGWMQKEQIFIFISMGKKEIKSWNFKTEAFTYEKQLYISHTNKAVLLSAPIYALYSILLTHWDYICQLAKLIVARHLGFLNNLHFSRIKSIMEISHQEFKTFPAVLFFCLW